MVHTFARKLFQSKCENVYLADAGCQAGVIVDASLHTAVAALAEWETHVAHCAPGHKEK